MHNPSEPMAILASQYHTLKAQLQPSTTQPNTSQAVNEIVLKQMDIVELTTLDLISDQR
ncbi:MAG: hypothetical protein GY819_04515 [Planctomycetaceae bacterium]|nr:hypothetical protein [Planctomycetaceae bacterium]MCP4462048.1 hypothetical protein [Planctomycetaceae bacterium]